jgi:sugar transferase EpsL
MLYKSLKLILDRLFALLLILLLLPLLAVLYLLVAWKLGFPVFFRQKRPGLNGRIFWMIKFRTMLNAQDTRGNMLPDAQRLTSFGKILRASSLDELPELWNVLRGDMSFVGPRPLLEEYLPLYNARQARRHEVRPGITGLAQVSGRNAISWDEKFEKDVWYVDHLSFLLDLKILLMTIYQVVKRDGIAAEGHVTTEKFRGSSSLM